MEIDSSEYFFYEWLILAKKLSEEALERLTCAEREQLVMEYKEFQKTLNPKVSYGVLL